MQKKNLQVCVPVADLKEKPEDSASLLTQSLLGRKVCVLEECAEGWLYVKNWCGYEGYMRSSFLAPYEDCPTHYILMPRVVSYYHANFKAQYKSILSVGSRILVTDTVTQSGIEYAFTELGHIVPTKSLSPLTCYFGDYVTIAEQMIYTPYLWGGTSSFGIDCSGLVQLSLSVAGKDVVRDSANQFQTIGKSVSDLELKRGDLVFWKGHVGIMIDCENFIHANVHSMMVSKEPLAPAIDRIGCPIGFRRPI